MTELLRTPIPSNLALAKLTNILSNLSSRMKEAESSSIVISTNEIYNTVSKYFKEIAEAEFDPEFILNNDVATSRLYNKNLISIYNDIKRFYEDLKNLSDAQIKSYNYAQIVSQDILTRANSLASIVLDLNILNNFDRGDVIIAGDDFNSLEYVDLGAGLGSTQAETLPGGSGMALARDSSIDVIDGNTKIEILPISPGGQNSAPGREPTVGNFQRFYEGNYYNFIGLARPEGGHFNFKQLLEPAAPIVDNTHFIVEDREREDEPDPTTVIVDLGASEEEKSLSRLRMFDRDPSTFWECEYLYKVPSDIFSSSIRIQDSEDTADVGGTSVISINTDQANTIARGLDEPGRDLIIDIIITLSETRSTNFVSINPILFGPDAYPEIIDIATATESDGEFKTVDGWNSLKFAKFLTAEANELLTDSQQNAVLAPTRASYKGQGIFNFPTREAKKLKIRMKVDSPVSSPYERVYALLSNNVKITTTNTTVTTRRKLF